MIAKIRFILGYSAREDFYSLLVKDEFMLIDTSHLLRGLSG
jgi:hypothetical protein